MTCKNSERQRCILCSLERRSKDRSGLSLPSSLRRARLSPTLSSAIQDAKSKPDATQNPESDLIQSDESALIHGLIDALPENLRFPLSSLRSHLKQHRLHPPPISTPDELLLARYVAANPESVAKTLASLKEPIRPLSIEPIKIDPLESESKNL